MNDDASRWLVATHWPLALFLVALVALVTVCVWQVLADNLAPFDSAASAARSEAQLLLVIVGLIAAFVWAAVS